jgi:hypothetical protein
VNPKINIENTQAGWKSKKELNNPNFKQTAMRANEFHSSLSSSLREIHMRDFP